MLKDSTFFVLLEGSLLHSAVTRRRCAGKKICRMSVLVAPNLDVTASGNVIIGKSRGCPTGHDDKRFSGPAGLEAY